MDNVGKWMDWNREGLFPGPNETKESFETRANYCQNIKWELTNQTNHFPFLEENGNKTKEILNEASEKSHALYGIRPSWVPLFFSNYQLAPWHGGCAWIFQMEENSPLGAFIQLRSKFKQQKTYLNLYKREELISHELSHIGRMAYNEPRFEEIFAYQSSSNSWRKWMGPLVQSWKESLLFIALVSSLIFLYFLFIFYPLQVIHQTIFSFELIIIGLLGYAIFRRIRCQKQYKNCLQSLEQLMPREDAKHLIYRLTDHEIKEFSHLSATKTQSYIQSQNSFRWLFLKHIYKIVK